MTFPESKTVASLLTMVYALLSSATNAQGMPQSRMPTSDASILNGTVTVNTSASSETYLNVTSSSTTVVTSRLRQDWNDDSLDQAIFIYIIAAMCLVVSVVLLCKYVICQRHLRSLSRRKSQEYGTREQIMREMTGSGLVLVPD